MKLDIPYGNTTETVELDDRNVELVLYPNSVRSGNEMEILRKAIDNPINSPGLEEFLKGKKNIVLVANDATRPTPTSRIMEIIYPVLKDKNFKILIATGSHRAPTEEEYEFIFGKLYPRIKDRVVVHDAKKSECVSIGRTRHGTEMCLNKLVTNADAIIPIGSVEPHYFAGYTGGRKSLLPGVASYDTITANHKLAISQQAQALKLKGNPVAEEMDDAEALFLKLNIFSIMTVLDSNHRTYAAAAGNLRDSFQALTKKADEVFCVPIKRQAEIVVTVATEPTDIDLYQSQKALDNGKYAMKEGGIIILVSACRSGIGSQTFLDLLGSEKTCQAVIEKLNREYKLGYHKAGKMAEIGLKSQMWAVTPLDPEIVRKAHMRPFRSVKEALKEALREKGPGAKVTFIMDGGLTIPRLT
ncbi:MAG: nickel-dependent lactate racemase [Thermoplasmata archaeon]